MINPAVAPTPLIAQTIIPALKSFMQPPKGMIIEFKKDMPLNETSGRARSVAKQEEFTVFMR